ncbi:MAG: D-alanyl-D-alanine carboxypeptidase, partial [Clostridia bacterium]|nr:D-alanyl-D-alanine carboxypeptidase [Clostridia bacterium]
MDKAWKKILFVLFAVILMVSLLSVPSFAAYNDEVDLQSNIYYMENLDQETVILSKNADKRTAMASLTKITTAMVVLDHEKNLDKVVKVTQEMMDTIANTNSSTAGIVAGEELTVRQLLNLMLVKSANEAASILAIHVAGDMASFVDLMNDYARKLG